MLLHEDSENPLYDTSMIDICHCAFVYILRFCSIKSEPYGKLWNLGNMTCQYRLTEGSTYIALVVEVGNGKEMHV